MDNKLVMISIAAVIGIIVLGSVLMPILDDATATTDKFTNDGYFRVSKVTEDTNITVSWSYDAPKTLTVGTKTIDLSNIPVDLAVTIVGNDKCMVRYQNYASGTAQRIQGYSDTLSYTGIAASTGNNGTFSAVISGFDVAYTFNGSTKTTTITEGFYADPDGDYIMKYSNQSAYVLSDDSVIVLSGQTDGYTLYATGTINDGLTIDDVAVGTSTVTYGDITFNYADVADHKDLVTLASCVFDRTVTTAEEVTTTTTLTYSYFVVPHEVIAERSVHFTPGENAIFAAIPVMIILAVLLGVVALVLRSRMD